MIRNITAGFAGAVGAALLLGNPYVLPYISLPNLGFARETVAKPSATPAMPSPAIPDHVRPLIERMRFWEPQDVKQVGNQTAVTFVARMNLYRRGGELGGKPILTPTFPAGKSLVVFVDASGKPLLEVPADEPAVASSEAIIFGSEAYARALKSQEDEIKATLAKLSNGPSAEDLRLSELRSTREREMAEQGKAALAAVAAFSGMSVPITISENGRPILESTVSIELQASTVVLAGGKVTANLAMSRHNQFVGPIGGCAASLVYVPMRTVDDGAWKTTTSAALMGSCVAESGKRSLVVVALKEPGQRTQAPTGKLMPPPAKARP